MVICPCKFAKQICGLIHFSPKWWAQIVICPCKFAKQICGLVHFSPKWWAQMVICPCKFAKQICGLIHFSPKWWAQMDSNHRPHAYQACALTSWAMSPKKPCGYGGGNRVRTDDPLLAGQVLYQLSYTPIRAFIKSGFYVDASGLLSAHPRKLQNKCSANVMLKEHWYIKNEEKETIQISVSTENG